MKKYTLPQKLSSIDGNLTQSEWILVDGNRPYYWFKNQEIDTRIIANVSHQNHRGITLYTFGISGEKIQFTLKPSQWIFIYEEEKTK